MLTEEPVEALAGPVDIWCPVTPNYDHAAAEKRRAAGDRFLVVRVHRSQGVLHAVHRPSGHRASRVALAQTWQRSIVGTLVWESNYWTSSAAFPRHTANPTKTRWAM